MATEIFNARNREERQQEQQTVPANMIDDHQPLSENKPHRPVDEYSEVMRAEPCSTNPLDAFAAKPENITFESQHRAETIVLMLRRHPFTQVPKILAAVFFALFPIFILPFFTQTIVLAPKFVFATLVLWFLFLFGFILETFLVWFFHVFIITDERIIDVDFLSLIYKRITAAKIDNIEDVTTVTGGAIRSVFDFGTVKVQTAGARPEIAFEDVPHPSRVKQLLNELLIEEEREKIEGRVN